MTVLRKGSRGPEVRKLQTLLNGSGVLRPRALSPDGVFGSQTHAAVVAFQKKKGLSADGIVGPKTWAAFDSDPRATFSVLYRPGPQEGLAGIAAAYIGATEARGNRSACRTPDEVFGSHTCIAR